MIAYKWVIEKEGKFYSLINFGIDTGIKNICIFPYELNKTYHSPLDLSPEKTKQTKRLMQLGFGSRDLPGYHFWNTIKNTTLPKWNKYLFMKKQPMINAVLKCEVNAIVVIENNYQGEGTRIIANEFKPIEIIKIK